MTDLARLREQQLSLTEPKNKQKWKQKLLRVLSLTHFVTLTYSEGSTSQKITFAVAQTLTPFLTHLQTHSKTDYTVSLPVILDPDLFLVGEYKTLSKYL